jgi:F-type H+-transporting ATPase subunit delta
VKESVRGYADAVIESAGAADVAEDLAAVRDLLGRSDDLRAVLADPGVAAHTRRALLADLLGGKIGSGTLGLLDHAVEVGRAPELPEDVASLAQRAAAARDGLVVAGPGVLSRHGAEDRLDGYATAVLAPVRDAGGLAEVEDELFRFGRVVAGSPELADALTGPERSPEVRAGIVRSLLEGRATDASVRLAAYAAKIGRPRDYLNLLDAIVARVGLETRRRIAEVRAAVALSDEQQARLAAALGRLSGQDVDVQVVVDPSVLGGFVATMGDTVVDGSVRHRLDLLRERLVRSEAPQPNEGAP